MLFMESRNSDHAYADELPVIRIVLSHHIEWIYIQLLISVAHTYC